MTREEAILTLWRNAIDELVIVHLDPAAQAICEVLKVEPENIYGNLVRGQIRIENARDTSKLDAKTSNVAIPWKAVGWPGRTFAQAFVVACWSSVMAHEGLETVLYKNRFDGVNVGPTVRLYDPHTKYVAIDAHGTHLATQGRMVELVQKFIDPEMEPAPSEWTEKDIQALTDRSASSLV